MTKTIIVFSPHKPEDQRIEVISEDRMKNILSHASYRRKIKSPPNCEWIQYKLRSDTYTRFIQITYNPNIDIFYMQKRGLPLCTICH
jgi:hypothetical protein